MSDILWGQVTRVVDGDTFDVTVTHYAKANAYQYNNEERIRLAGGNAPEMSSLEGILAKSKLESKLNGRNVQLVIHSRDTYHRLVCDVTLT